jgi:hypothetical protein
MRVLKDKHFWAGFLVAYLVAAVFPPSKLLGGMKKKGS